MRRESVSTLDTLPAEAVPGCVRSSNTTPRTLVCSLLLLVAACQMSIDVNCAGFKELVCGRCWRASADTVGKVVGEGMPPSASRAPAETPLKAGVEAGSSVCPGSIGRHAARLLTRRRPPRSEKKRLFRTQKNNTTRQSCLRVWAMPPAFPHALECHLSRSSPVSLAGFTWRPARAHVSGCA